MAAWKRNGRASDMFSLGCVLLETLVLHDQGTLQQLQLNRSSDPAFHANLDRVDVWFEGPSPKPSSPRIASLKSEIKSMLARDPQMRPTAKELFLRVTGYDLAQMITAKHSVFGDCCRSNFMSLKERDREKLGYTNAISHMRSDLERAHEDLIEMKEQTTRVVKEHTNASAQLRLAQAGSDIGSTCRHTNTSQELMKTLRTENDELNLRILEMNQTHPEKFNKLTSSTIQRNGNNAKHTKASNSEWCIEKQQLEQRIAELEARGGMSIPLPSALPAVVVVPQGTPKPRKKQAPGPFFRWAAGPAKKKVHPGDLEYGETQEERRTTSKRDNSEEIRVIPTRTYNSSSGFRRYDSFHPGFQPYFIPEEKSESKQRREDRERERTGEERYVYRSQASEDSQ
jgi:serine/threonine protein kinase